MVINVKSKMIGVYFLCLLLGMVSCKPGEISSQKSGENASSSPEQTAPEINPKPPIDSGEDVAVIVTPPAPGPVVLPPVIEPPVVLPMPIGVTRFPFQGGDDDSQERSQCEEDPKRFQCEEDEHCKNHGKCIIGTCKNSECKYSAVVCQSDEICNPSTGLCQCRGVVCNGVCNPLGDCCRNADCPLNETCENGLCNCFGTVCDGICDPNAICCTNAECCGGEVCVNRLCACPAGQVCPGNI